MISTLTTLFGVLGLLLAAAGLYGVMAYVAEQRTGGDRHSNGARGRIAGVMVLRGAFSQVGIRLAIGIPAAIGAGRLMKDQLFGVKPWDPVMLVFATLLLRVGSRACVSDSGASPRGGLSRWWHCGASRQKNRCFLVKEAPRRNLVSGPSEAGVATSPEL